MISSLEVPFRAFFRADEQPSAFRDLLVNCLARRRTLSARIGANAVVIEVGDEASDELRLSGQWCAPELRFACVDEVGIKLILPFLLNISQVRLPYDQIYTLGRPYRSIADFFVRNVFLATVRNVQIAFEENSSKEASPDNLSEFRRQYYYIIKAEFSEMAFQARSAGDVLGLILANTYLPVLNFENPLLRHGAGALRKLIDTGPHNDIAALKAQITEARTDMMSFYGT